MAILLPGGAGFIGSHTAVELLNKGREIVIIDNFSNSTPKALEAIKKITGKESKTQKTSNPIYINQFALKECSTKSIISSIITKEKSTATKNSKTYPLCLISK